MSPDFVRRMSAPVPRYTSYPTAANFRGDVGPLAFAESLTRLGPDGALSLYVHIPFCAQLCWYCGCNMKVVRSRETISDYLKSLEVEMMVAAELLTNQKVVSHIHWGGGSPNMLSETEMSALAELTHRLFAVSASAEFSIEIDPRTFTPEQAKALAAARATRVSVGVQDFDPVVQRAINRQQSFDVTEQSITAIRSAGIGAINIDLVYGLPHQTRAGLERTIEQVLRLEPNRIALFGYAHLPSRLKHQALIDDAVLPNAVERFAQLQRAKRLLQSAGYIQVGLDHFARPDDPLAAGPVRRNFQGYTTDTAAALVGFGASAISSLPDGYFQNAAAPKDYMGRVADTGLATARGVLLTEEDRVRAFVIERLMCDYAYSEDEVRKEFGAAASGVAHEADEVLRSDRDGLLEKTPDGFRLTARGRPFVRAVAACFDAYFGEAGAAGSIAV